MAEPLPFEHELLAFASPEQRKWLLERSLSADHEQVLLSRLRNQLDTWRADLTPTREQILQSTHETNRMHASIHGGDAEFWKGLEAEYRELQKPTVWEPSEQWSQEAKDWLEQERHNGQIFESEEKANDAYIVSQRYVWTRRPDSKRFLEQQRRIKVALEKNREIQEKFKASAKSVVPGVSPPITPEPGSILDNLNKFSEAIVNVLTKAPVAPIEQRAEVPSIESAEESEVCRSPVMLEFHERMERYRSHLAWLKNEIGDSKILVWLLAPLAWAGGLTAMQMDQYIIAIALFFATFGVVAIKAIAVTKDRERTVLILVLAILFFGAHVTWVIYTHKQFAKRTASTEASIGQQSLTISPSAMSLITTKGHKSIQEVFVHNATQVAYYDVRVKVTMDSPSIEAKKIEIHRRGGTPINVAPDPAEALDNMLVVESPAPGKNFFSFWAARLTPNETKRYVVSYQNDGELSEGADHKLIFAVDRFTTTPASHGSRPVSGQ